MTTTGVPNRHRSAADPLSDIRAALAAAGRNHDLSDDDLDTAEQAWEQFWAAVRPVELTAAVERHAGQRTPITLNRQPEPPDTQRQRLSPTPTPHNEVFSATFS